MKDEYKRLRPWLESWGAWRRMSMILDYPSNSMSCNPDLHISLTEPEPTWKMPIWNERLTPEHNAERLRDYEKKLREFHYIKRNYGKQQQTSRVPNYDPNWRLNFIDREIQMLPKLQIQVIRLKYENEYKVKEIPVLIDRTIDAVHKRMADAHENLKHIPSIVVSRETYSLYLANCRTLAFG